MKYNKTVISIACMLSLATGHVFTVYRHTMFYLSYSQIAKLASENKNLPEKSVSEGKLLYSLNMTMFMK